MITEAQQKMEIVLHEMKDQQAAKAVACRLLGDHRWHYCGGDSRSSPLRFCFDCDKTQEKTFVEVQHPYGWMDKQERWVDI